MTEQNPRERLYGAIQQDVDPKTYKSTVPNCLICQVALRRGLPLGTRSYADAVASHFKLPDALVWAIFYGVIGAEDTDSPVPDETLLRWRDLGKTYEGALQIAREILIDRVLEETE